jgi:hypothetical protein
MNRKARIGLGADPARIEGPQGLLRKERTQGYPSEYLLSRIRGRRFRLIRDWRPLIYDASPLVYLASPLYQGFIRERTPEGMWRALLLEHGWVHGQMDEEMRRAFAPYFLYAELRTVFIGLRSLQGDKVQKAAEVLSVSLLSDEAKSVLREGEAADALVGLETLFKALSPSFAGIASAYEEKGLRGVEHLLAHRYLAYVGQTLLHQAIRGFFVRVIDSRNVLTLYKALRTGSPGAGQFLEGGMVPVERLTDILEREDILGVAGLIRQATGLVITSPDPTQVETALYRGITRFLKGECRDPLDAAILLDYLWRCQLEVMNLSMLFAGKDLERNEVAAELIR